MLVVQMDIAARLTDTPGHRLDDGGSILAVAGPVDAGDDDAGRVIRLDATIEEVQWFADDPRVDHILHRIARLVVGLRIVRGVLRMSDLHMGYLFRCGAVVVHVA